VLNQILAAGRPDSVRRMRVIAWRIGVWVISFSVLHVHQRLATPSDQPRRTKKERCRPDFSLIAPGIVEIRGTAARLRLQAKTAW
jgi:hypothetical protein